MRSIQDRQLSSGFLGEGDQHGSRQSWMATSTLAANPALLEQAKFGPILLPLLQCVAVDQIFLLRMLIRRIQQMQSWVTLRKQSYEYTRLTSKSSISYFSLL